MWPLAQVGPLPFISITCKVALLCALLTSGSTQSSDGYTDENRPYEFGFTIEGEQHRYEKKDERGIIMGEYGFITADGVYHVTVYATDENGNFKILKTKNIRIGLPMARTPTTTTTSKPPSRTLSGVRGCSGCLIPTTAAPPSIPNPAQGFKTHTLEGSRSPIDPRIDSGPQFHINLQDKNVPGSRTSDQVRSTTRGPDLPGQTGGINSPNSEKTSRINTPYSEKSGGISIPNSDKVGGLNVLLLEGMEEKFTPGSANKLQGARAKEKSGTSYSNSKEPMKDIEKKILDFMARLYKFNYTLTFHGHEEEGDVAGNKRGSYFNNGRDGYQRKVVYVANEFGYQPQITLVKLDSVGTPNELTEKELTKLKGNEFIWFYDKILR